jgi:hypothetical protein
MYIIRATTVARTVCLAKAPYSTVRRREVLVVSPPLATLLGRGPWRVLLGGQSWCKRVFDMEQKGEVPASGHGPAVPTWGQEHLTTLPALAQSSSQQIRAVSDTLAECTALCHCQAWAWLRGSGRGERGEGEGTWNLGLGGIELAALERRSPTWDATSCATMHQNPFQMLQGVGDLTVQGVRRVGCLASTLMTAGIEKATCT